MSDKTGQAIQEMETYPLDKLLYRRQFVLGPRFVERLGSWQKIKIRDAMCLTVHPDLPVAQVVHQNKKLILLGYILDAGNPQATDVEIMDRLLHQIQNPNDIAEYTGNLGGRWILILDDGNEVILFNDATGLRQVFYTSDSALGIWCASQPGIMAEELNLKMDEDALNNFINTPEYNKTLEIWWPGDTSPFKEIKHLLPNRYLDLRKGTTHRYWPDRTINQISLEEGVKRASEMLRALMTAARNRFDLAITITSGFDTRVILAASREICQGVDYCTYIAPLWGITEDGPDLTISAKLLSQLGLKDKHNIIRIPSQMDNDFAEIYKRNVSVPHEVWGTISQALYHHLPQNLLYVRGVLSNEIIRPYHPVPVDTKTVTAETLAGFAYVAVNPFMVKHVANWLSEAREAALKYNIHILELYGWEQRTGNWQAMSQTEGDITHEVFTPYNCRNLLATFFAVDGKYRKYPDYRLSRELVRYMWPEILKEPINPPTRLKVRVIDFLMRVHLYRPLRFISRIFKR